MTDPYRRPSLPPLPGDRPEYDPLRAFNNYRRDTNVQGYKPSSLEGYFQSRQSSPYARGTARPDAGGYTPAAPPERFQFDLLAGLGEGVMGAAGSGLGQAFLGTPPEQRGGSQPLLVEGGPRLATAPVNFQNFATYAREGQLSLITSALGHKYQQPEGEDPYARPVGYESGRNIAENIGQGDLEGVLGNVIDGLGAVGDAINEPLVAATNWWRGWVASDRAREVRSLAQTGVAGQGQFRLIRTITHITGLDSISDWEGIARHAADKGIDTRSAMTELFDLSPQVIEAILAKPDMSDEDLTELTREEPFSYDPASDLIANLVVTLAPMLGAAKLVTTGAKLASGLRAGRAITAAHPGYVPGRIMATADRIGSWAAQPLWRRSLKLTGAVTGFSPTGIKIGAGIRAGEWLFKQIGVSLGNEAMVEAADRWLYEMPLSTSPGLMMLDAFAVHPLRGAKELYAGAKGAAARIAGKGEVPVSKVYADRIGTIADADFDTMTPIIERLGWDRGVIDAVFGDGGPLSVNDFKNGLMHLALEKVRQQHEARASRLLPEGTGVERTEAFLREYGDEAAKLLGDEISGRSTALTDELRVEFWERSQLIDAAELGGEGYIGPYDPSTALVGFASWMRFSKLVAEAADDVLVAKLRTDVNTEFVRAYREAIEGSYAKPGSILSQRDLNRLRTFVPASAAVLKRSGDRVPKISKRQMLKLLDQLEREQGSRDLAANRPRNEAVPALSELEATDPASIARVFRLHQATVEALQRALVEGVDALGPVPPEIARVLQALHNLNSEHVRRDPKAAWTRAAEWFESQLASAVSRGELITRLKDWRQAVETRAPRTRNAELDLDLEAIKRVEESLNRPYANAELKDPSDRAFAAARDADVEAFMDRLGAWLENDDRKLTVERVGDLDVLAGDGFRPNDLAIIEDVRAKALRSNLSLLPDEAAILADPLSHPLEVANVLARALDEGLRVSKVQERAIRAMPDLEGAYGVLADDVLGPDPARAVNRAVVEDLTKRGARHAQEFTDLRTSGRALGGLIERTPGRVLTEDSRAFLERAAVLGATKVGVGPKGTRVENWRTVLIEPEGVRAVSNADTIARGRQVLEHDLAVRQNVLDHYSSLLERQQARMTDTLTVDDFTWTSAGEYRTRKAALEIARELHDAGIFTRQPVKVGSKWLLERGELKERPSSPPESAQGAPEAPEVVSEPIQPETAPLEVAAQQPELRPGTAPEGAPPPEPSTAVEVRRAAMVDAISQAEARNAAAADAFAAAQDIEAAAFEAKKAAYRPAVPFTTGGPAPREVAFLDPADNKTPVRARIVLAEAEQLLTSDEAGYPQMFQPRSRDLRVTLDDQIKAWAADLQPDKLVGMTEGAQGTPVVAPGGAVIAGNGRTAAIRLAAKAEYEKYRARIVAEATAQGFDPAVIAGMDRPMLVRELVDVTPETMERLGWQLNPTGMAVGDLAAKFAGEITATDLAQLRSGGKSADLRDIIVNARNTAVVKLILARLPPDWVAQYLDPAGKLNKDGVELVEGSIFAKLLRADDRTLPMYERARNLVISAVEQGGEEMRRIFNGVFDAAPEMLKAQNAAEAGTIGREFLAITDRLVEALDDILRRRRDGKTMAQIALDLSTVDAFAEYTLHPVTSHLARIIANSTGEGEIGAFLRAVAKSTVANAEPGLFGDVIPVEASGLLNEGVKAWNKVRDEWNVAHADSAQKVLIDNFPSEQAPFDTALTGTRVLDDGSTAPPVVKSQPLLPEELGGEINSRLAGEIAEQVVEGPDQILADVPGEIRFTDPDNVRLMDALREDSPAVRRDLADVLATFESFGTEAAKGDFLAGLIDSVNDGTATPAEWLFLSVATQVRRSARGKLNMKPFAQATPDVIRSTAEQRLLRMSERSIGPAAPTAQVHRPTTQRPIDAAAYADDTGLPPETVTDAATPGMAEAAATGEHTIVVNENPTASSTLRRAVGAPKVVDPVRSVIELNAPEPQVAAERLSALRQQAAAVLAEQQRKLADYDANPPLEPTGEVSSVFVDPGAGALWTKFMEGVGRDELAPALGAVEPTSLAALQDAIESIERGVLTDPITGKGLTPTEGAQLLGELARLRNATLERAIEARTGRRQAATAARIRPKEPGDYDADLYDRAAAVVDDLGQVVVNDPSLSPLDGFMGTQYVLSKAPTVSKVDKAPLSPRLPFRDYFAGDIIPGLLEEVQSGRMMTLDERTARVRATNLIDAVAGGRPERRLRVAAIDNFKAELGRYFDPELRPTEFEKLDKLVDTVMRIWRERLADEKLAGLGYRIYRRIDLMGPEKVNKMFGEAVTEVYGADPPPFVAAMQADGRTVHQLWRRADNRIRQALIRSDRPLFERLEEYHGRIGDSVLGSTNRWVTVAYQLARFTAEIRWLALEASEPFLLTGIQGGLRPVIEGASAGAFAKAKPVLTLGQRRQLSFHNAMQWAQVADMEQVGHRRHRMFVREVARQQGKFVDVVNRMVREDPGLARLIGETGDTPAQFLERLDRDWSTVGATAREFKTTGEASAFFKPWLDAGVITEPQFREYVQGKKYSYSPAIEAEIARAKTVSDPVAAALYERLAQLNQQLVHDVTATMFGQENRSNLQRALNHPFLYWPISYQIKATKWLLRFMLEESFGVDSGAIGGLAIQRVYDEHKRRMQTDEIYREKLTQNNTLYFVSSMLLPIAPWDIGVSLSPWSRMALNQVGVFDQYDRPGGVLGFGWTQTMSFIGRLVQEQTSGDARRRLQQFFPIQISTRAAVPERPVSQAAYEEQRIGGGLPVVPIEVPAVPRLP